MEIAINEDPNIVDSQSYYYANNQMVSRLDQSSDPNDNACYYYPIDRLGSVRLMLDTNAAPQNSYTYDPFGNHLESETYETVDNAYQFAGYCWDQDAEMFYCNASWYNPEIYRFTGRDPVRGKYKEPLTLHAYLYCVNDPINNKDTNGKCFFTIAVFLAGSAIRLYLQGEDNARVGATVTAALSFIGVIMDYYLFWPKVQSVVDRFGGKQTQIPTEKGINKMDENEIIDKFIENQQKNSG